MNGVSKSPSGVTKDADSSAVGEGVDSLLKESNSRGGSELSPSAFRLSLPRSNKKRRACQHSTDSILSLSGRTELDVVPFRTRRLGQLSNGCRDLNARHQGPGAAVGVVTCEVNGEAWSLFGEVDHTVQIIWNM